MWVLLGAFIVAVFTVNGSGATMNCDVCQKPITIGEWPFCPHGRAQASKGFEEYIDWNISDQPVRITTPGDRRKHLKPHWQDDHIVHMQERR